MADEFNHEKARSDFLIAMYNQLMNDINRHIVVVWQSVAALIAAFAVFSLVDKNILSLDFAVTLIVLVCVWMIAHIYDASYWYNRNLVIIANIERQFLRVSDLKDIHYYFGAHRRSGAMITHLEIQRLLAIGIWGLVLLLQLIGTVIPEILDAKPQAWTHALPWLATILGLAVWWNASRKATERYDAFLRNSPGREIDNSSIQPGPGHPT